MSAGTSYQLSRLGRMDQAAAPIVDALAAAEKMTIHGFGAPGHHSGSAMPRSLRALAGRRVFKADVLTPRGLDDRTESGHILQRAHEIAAEAWGADLCRFATGGSTQSLHTALAAVARPGDTVAIAANAHKAEFSSVLFAGLHPAVIPVTHAPAWDLEHGVSSSDLAATLDAHPDAKAALVVSPTYFGVTSDIAALARVAHARGVPLIVDAAWGGAFGFSPRLPANPLAQGADIMIASLHKTMGALAQGSVMLVRGDLVDQQRFALAYELFQTTSPATAIMASMDATRRDHVLNGEKIWGDVLNVAASARDELDAIPGLRILGAEELGRDGAFDLDRSKITIDIARLGVAGYAIDDWLYREHRVSVALSDARHLIAIIGIGTTAADVCQLTRGLRALVDALKSDPGMLPAAPSVIPPLASLSFELAASPVDAFFGKVEEIAYEAAAGRIAAEIVAPAPPGVPRLIPGQRISEAHAKWLATNRDAGMFVLDPVDPSQRRIRVTA